MIDPGRTNSGTVSNRGRGLDVLAGGRTRPGPEIIPGRAARRQIHGLRGGAGSGHGCHHEGRAKKVLVANAQTFGSFGKSMTSGA